MSDDGLLMKLGLSVADIACRSSSDTRLLRPSRYSARRMQQFVRVERRNRLYLVESTPPSIRGLELDNIAVSETEYLRAVYSVTAAHACHVPHSLTTMILKLGLGSRTLPAEIAIPAFHQPGYSRIYAPSTASPANAMQYDEQSTAGHQAANYQYDR